jgi:glycosyltransferase involved in cell wall biosynthesis
MFSSSVTTTVLMAVYNDEEFLEESLDSILSQLSEDMELLVIDDGSSDRSRQILVDLARQTDRVRVMRNSKNEGLGYCLAFGTEQARGKYVIRMDSDDICLPGRFAKQVNFLDENPNIDIVGGFAIEIDAHGNKGIERKMPLSHAQIQSAIWACPLIHPTVIFRRERVLLAGNYQHQASRRQEDYELWFRCIKSGLRFANIPEPLIYYRFTPESQSKQRFKQAMYQVRVGWHGCLMLHLPWWQYLAVTTPIFRAIFPVRVSYFIYRLLKPFDPRKGLT